MKMTNRLSIILSIALLSACGGSDSRPEGTYNYVTDSDTATIGCSDDFMAFISSASGGGVTKLEVKLAPAGENSLDFEYNDLKTTLTSTTESKWAGAVVGSFNLSGCHITESIDITIQDLGENMIKVNFDDQWESTPINGSCPFAPGNCRNKLSAKAKKI